jgi:diguanylate cyclase (GGDEF)-like protein
MLVGSSTTVDQIAILYIDLDGFKAVNDTFGHRVGDDILIAFAERLRTCVRPGDVVARLGGDEFAALLVGTTETQASIVADRVVLTATAPFLHEDQLVSVSATVGVAMASDIAHETELTQLDVLLRHADGAMLQAKNAGKRRVGRLDGRTNTAPFARHGQIRRRMREALATGDFALHYQPKLDLSSGDVTQVEALIRWHDAELGSVSPAEFIPIAEAGDEIHLLGRWVIDEACAQAGRWIQAGTPHVIAVNVSPRQFTSGRLVDDVLEALHRWSVPASMLRVEITEGSAIVDVPGAVEQLDVLRSSGIEVDLDDFGTGYSSLTMLHVLPLSAVKIDRTFIDCVDRSNADALMIGGVIDAAHALGLTVIAEGVERQEQLDVLRQLGCDEAQGFLISRPVTARGIDSMAVRTIEST